MSHLRPVITSVAGLLCATGIFAQVIQGVLEHPLPAGHVVLYGTRGSQHPALDSVHVAADGTFSFGPRRWPAGFYQLGINDDDRVDFVIDPTEPVIELAFHGIPLQRNMNVLRSSENQRLWSYKLKSREGQELISALQEQRSTASPLDTALLRGLDRNEFRVRGDLRHALDSLVSIHPDGPFALAVQADRRLDSAIAGGPHLIRAVFDFSDPRSLRGSAYAKAILLYLQTTSYTADMPFHRACDTLLSEAAKDTSCWNYMRWQLMDMLTTYGPDDVAQYIVDRYVVGPDAIVPPDASLLAMAAGQLRMVAGASAPDMILVKPGIADTLHLSNVWPEHDFTSLFFYSSTCDHCHAQMPGLVELVKEMRPSRFQLIGIALDTTEEEFRNTLNEEMINWPCFTELKAWGAQAAKDYNVKATPSLFVLDRAGKIRAKPMDHQELRAFLEQTEK